MFAIRWPASTWLRTTVEPSGAAKIGSWALGVALRARLVGAPSALFDTFARALNAPDVDSLVRWAEEHDTADKRGEPFRLVAETAAEGDVAARDLLAAAGRDLAAVTIALARHMDLGQPGKPVTVVLAGSAWRARGTLVEAFRESIARDLPTAQLNWNEVSQAQGAALLAMRHAGLDRGPDIFARLDSQVGLVGRPTPAPVVAPAPGVPPPRSRGPSPYGCETVTLDQQVEEVGRRK